MLLNELKGIKDDYEKMEIISEIKKLFVKLEQDKKQFFYPKITLFLNNEQKIDFLLSLGYTQITNKKIESAIKIYEALSVIYTTLDKKEKDYYYPIFLRYSSSIKTARKKR
jgi:hypothetical protein